MISTNRILPGHKVPELQLESNFPQGFNLRTNLKEVENYLLLFFYRGEHSKFCKDYLKKLDKMVKKFEKNGMKIVAISMDNEEAAKKTIKNWKLEKLQLAHGLSFEIAKVWGLFLSSIKQENVIHRFNEPAVFVVDSEGSLYLAHIQSMPFARPSPKKMLKRLKWCKKKKFPVQGTMD